MYDFSKTPRLVLFSVWSLHYIKYVEFIKVVNAKFNISVQYSKVKNDEPLVKIREGQMSHCD